MLPERAAFDALAVPYDSRFSQSISGRLQRERVHRYLKKYTSGRPLRILEINCGTGEDALWLASKGHTVTATDISPEMIRIAKQKQSGSAGAEFSVCAFHDLKTCFAGHQFDLIFSNFSGLNCVSGNELQSLNNDLYSLLGKNGKIAAVLFGKYCWMERLYFFLKNKNGNRRLKPSTVMLSAEAPQDVWYYSATEFSEFFPSFSLLEKKVVGLFIPPSYLERRMKPAYVPFIRLLEAGFASLPFVADAGDHVFVTLQKK